MEMTEQELDQLPVIKTTVLGFEDGNKESIAVLAGDLRWDHFHLAIKSGPSFLAAESHEDPDGPSAKALKERLRRVFFVVDCSQFKDQVYIDQPPPPKAA